MANTCTRQFGSFAWRGSILFGASASRSPVKLSILLASKVGGGAPGPPVWLNVRSAITLFWHVKETITSWPVKAKIENHWCLGSALWWLGQTSAAEEGSSAAGVARMCSFANLEEFF